MKSGTTRRTLTQSSAPVTGKPNSLAAAHRKFREGSATKIKIKALLEQIETDQQASALHWLPITDQHLQRVSQVFAKAPA